jgi:glucose 1-dehydrogenase
MIADIDDAAGSAGRRHFKLEMATVRFTATDVSERLDVRNLVAKTHRCLRHHRYALVNNAGIVHATDFLDLEEADFDRVMGVNLKSAVPVRAGGGAAHGRTDRKRAEETRLPAASSTCRRSTTVYSRSPTRWPTRSPRAGCQPVDQGDGAGAGTPRHSRQRGRAGLDHDRPACESVLSSDAEATRHRILSRTPLGRIGDPSEIAAVTVSSCSRQFRRQLCHRADDVCRWRTDAAQLHGSGKRLAGTAQGCRHLKGRYDKGPAMPGLLYCVRI